MAGNRGVTCRELADQWGTGMNCISGRFSELKRDGQIAAKGRRDGCAVYVCTPDDAGTKDHPIQNQPHSTRLLSRVMEAEKELHHGLRPTAPFIRTWLNDRINLRDVPALSRIEVPVPGEGILSVAIDDPELQDSSSPLRGHWMLAAEAYFWAAHHEEMRKFKGGKP